MSGTVNNPKPVFINLFPVYTHTEAPTMPEVEAPITGTEIDTSDPIGSLKNVVYGVLGIGLFIMLVNYGGVVGDRVTDFTDNLLGTNASGENVFTRGEL